MRDLKQIVESLKKSKFTCEAGDLVNCIPFIELEEKSNEVSYCCLGWEHSCPMNVNDGFCAADTCQYKVKAL